MKRARVLSIAIFLLAATVVFAQTADNPAPAQATANVARNPDKIDVSTPTLWTGTPVLFGPEQEAFRQSVQDVLFDFDKATINPSGKQALQADADWLKQHPDINFYLDGYADWRGPLLYNLRLAQDRADAVKQALTEMGVPEDRILVTAGWGKLYPICLEQDESCWSRNRRVNLVYAPAGAATVASVR